MQNNNNIAIKTKNLNFKYSKSGNFCLNNINIKINKASITAILGQNGCGKSTLLKCLSSQINNYSGQIFINKNDELKNIATLNSNERSKIISIVNQQAFQSQLSVYDTIMLGRNPYINVSPKNVDYQATTHAVDMLNLNALCLKPCNELSGGELQSVKIAQAFAQNTPILLLDEPTNNLDIKKQNEVFNTIQNQIFSKNLTVLCVLHDINTALKYCDNLIFMKSGCIIKYGKNNILNEQLIKEVYNVDAKIIYDNNRQFIIT